MSEFPPIRVLMQMDGGDICYGHIYKNVLDVQVDGAWVQLWVKFEDDKFQDRYLLDSSIASFNVLHRPRKEGELPIFWSSL